jgi:hypothetical protein
LTSWEPAGGWDTLAVEAPASTLKADWGRGIVCPGAITQWAAVRTCVASSTEPPHAWFPPISRNTWYGTVSIAIGVPPTTNGLRG